MASRSFVASLLFAGCDHVARSRDAPAAPSAGSSRLDGVIRGCSQVFRVDCEWVLYNYVAQWWVSASFCRVRRSSATVTDTTVCHGLSFVHWRSFTAESRKLTLIFVSEQAGGKAGKDSGKAKAKAVSRSARAGLQVSRTDIERINIQTESMNKPTCIQVIHSNCYISSVRYCGFTG